MKVILILFGTGLIMEINEETKNEIRTYLEDSGIIDLMKSGYIFDFGVLTPFVEECGIKPSTPKTTNYVE